MPPLSEVPAGAWFCPGCQKKRVSSGIYDGSEVESIWNVRDTVIMAPSETDSASAVIFGEILDVSLGGSEF